MISRSRPTVRMNMFMDADLKERLHILAAAEHRSLASLIEETLEERERAGPRAEYVAKKGVQP